MIAKEGSVLVAEVVGASLMVKARSAKIGLGVAARLAVTSSVEGASVVASVCLPLDSSHSPRKLRSIPRK